MFAWSKDGGAASNVWGLYMPEIKRLFSIVLLRFEGKCREAYHNHAFHSLAWVLRGRLSEQNLDGTVVEYKPRLLPYVFPRSRFHRVSSDSTTWVLNLRGPWKDTWQEYKGGRFVTMTHGRKVVEGAEWQQY